MSELLPNEQQCARKRGCGVLPDGSYQCDCTPEDLAVPPSNESSEVIIADDDGDEL